MQRTFVTSTLRTSIDLSGSGWTFSPMEGEHAGKSFPVTIPCVWETIPGFESYRGKGVFRKSFRAGGCLRLEFGGVSHTGEILFDGKKLGSHYNAYTSFSFALKDVQEGEHLLEVIADNTFSEKSALHVPNDYMTYGGISRGVLAEEISDTWIESVHVVPKKDTEGYSARIRVHIRNLAEEKRSGTLLVEIPGVGQTELAFSCGPRGEQILETGIRAENVTEWCPEHPALYQIHTVLKTNDRALDDLTDRFGFRTIEIRGRDILLNGRKLLIKGFCRHEDSPLFGCALPLAAMQKDLELIRDLKGNAVRTTHYPNDPLFLDLCDEQGILVWEENHARGLSEEQMRNPNFESQEEQVTREMVDQHINHPSILIWGILNECASDTEYGYTCYKKQYEILKELDPSRPRSSASCKFKTDICFGLPDIVSYNIYPEWYVDQPAKEYLADLYQWVQNESKGSGKPFLITETGAGAILGYHSPAMVKWSEEYQSTALEDQLHAILELDGCSGVFIWQFADNRVSDSWALHRPRTMNNKGVVDEYRRRKLSYETVKRIFSAYGNYTD